MEKKHDDEENEYNQKENMDLEEVNIEEELVSSL
jgi:hypothetical protein